MEFYKRDEFKDKCGIYSIVNHLTGDVYIGQTSQEFLKRFFHHDWKLRDGSHDNAHLQRAFNLYGEQYFSFIPLKVLDRDDNSKNLDELEIKYISIMREMNHCYNILDGGNTSKRGLHLTEEHKRAIGEKNRINMLGRKHSEETKKKMSKAHKGKHQNRTDYRMNAEQVVAAKQLLISGMTASDVAKQIGVDYKAINALIANNTWSDIIVDGWDDFLANRKTYHRLTKKDHEEIYRKHIEEGLDKYQLASMYDRTPNMIYQILRKFKGD